MEENIKNIQVEFLLEEQSMENVLRAMLPKILPFGYLLDVNCFLRPHNGKSDLKKSIRIKIKTFSNFYKPTKVIIIHDQDSWNCIDLKNEIDELCKSSGNCEKLIRIACRELENWYLGDMNAIESIYPNFKATKYQSRAKFRNPDNCFGAFELEKMIPGFQKGFASRNIPKHFSIDQNKSPSFNQTVQGIQKFLN